MSDFQKIEEIERELIGEFPLSVSARVAMQLGRESISSSFTAILELVKNAYDADATKVSIRFQRFGSDDARLIIEDNGRGMTLDELNNHWMVIGTSNKAKVRKTAKGRVPTGEKGLGRLGLDRLCSRTCVQTISKDSSALELDIYWSKYEEAESRLENIAHKIYKISNFDLDPITRRRELFSHGTRLILEHLKDDWSEEAVRDLRAELSLLISPFSAPNDFAIDLDSGFEAEALNGTITSPPFILDAATWKVVATIGSKADGYKVNIHMQSARHETEYHLRDVPWKDWMKDAGDESQCGPLSMEFYYFPREKSYAGEQILTRAEVVQFLESNQGVRIYRDGFRVKPYGQPNGEGDWLRFAFLKARSPEGAAQEGPMGAWRISYHQIVGAVFLTHEFNPQLSDQTNREGLVEGKAFAHLRAFATKVVRFFEFNHQKFARAKKAEEVQVDDAESKAKASVVASDSAIKQLSTLLEKMRKPSSGGPSQLAKLSGELDDAVARTQALLEQAKASAAESVAAIAAEKAQAERQKNMLSNLASLGILAAAFGHESVDWAGNVVKYAERLDDDVISKAWWIAEAERPDVQKTMKFLVSESKKLRKFAKFTLGNISREKRKKGVLCLRRIAESVFAAFKEIIEGEKKIRPEFPTQGEYLVEGYPMDWESIFVNLIVNSAWAMEATPVADRRICVQMSTEGDSHVIQFDDTGKGLETGTEDAIFEATFTTKRNERGEEIGTGLGLTIVKAFVEDHSHGSITAKNSGQLSGASFRIIVPAWKKSKNSNRS